MEALIRRHPLIVALTAICVVLLVIIGLEVGWGGSGSDATASGAPLKVATVDAKLLPPLDRTPPEQAFPETAARPLFIPTRRPAPPAAAPTASMVKGQYVLHGVTMVGDIRIALLKDKSGKTHRVEKGKELNGMTVAEVEPERVTLRMGGDQEVLALLVHKSTGEAIPASVAQSGPFPVPAPVPTVALPGQPAAVGAPPATATVTPALRAGMPTVPGSPPAVPGQPTPGGAAAPPKGAASAAPPSITPEEAMARRRASRGQAAQPQQQPQ
ncbi:hypothetical protein [Usitatibacter palustris]|uniref:Type II secretion system protein GspC N-terminal domain-containing protein n=1 Tax=Usitatibacter palustris TaxID=2732487 RepID=A0A6M4HB86_9PROT|nr:hypothetical protein [Usitatibacter palustris]QJR16472.1 hypothetical protein DSM104440_03307 [Usitatibacter palustris]